MKGIRPGKPRPMPDGETELYEYLEALIKPSRTHEKGSSMNSETKNVKSYGNYPESPATAQETPTMTISKGLTTLKYMINQGTTRQGATPRVCRPSKMGYAVTRQRDRKP